MIGMAAFGMANGVAWRWLGSKMMQWAYDEWWDQLEDATIYDYHSRDWVQQGLATLCQKMCDELRLFCPICWKHRPDSWRQCGWCEEWVGAGCVPENCWMGDRIGTCRPCYKRRRMARVLARVLLAPAAKIVSLYADAATAAACISCSSTDIERAKV